MSNLTELSSELREVEPDLSDKEISALASIATQIEKEVSLQVPSEEGLNRNKADFLKQIELRAD